MSAGGPATAVIGGGLMGLAVAERLAARGCPVTVYEAADRLGGLTTHHDFGPFVWDRFYHVILPSDTALVAFLHRIGLADRLRWRRSHTGFYIDGCMWPLSSTLDFLRFAPLGPLGKLRLALTILRGARIRDWRALEKIPVETWLRRWSGDRVFERLWRPLLMAKLGEAHRRVSAVFIWSYIKRMYSARDSAAVGREQLGYVEGGYRTVFERLAERIESGGGRIRLRTPVAKLRPDGEELVVEAGGAAQRYARVVFTGPVDALERVVDPRLRQVDGGGPVEYLGVICGALVSRRPLIPYYVLNLADGGLPFTGVIGMSSLVDPKQTAGLHLTYLPKYVSADDPLLEADDEALRALFLDGLRRLFPDLDARGVVALHINRARRVQPLQVLDYSQRVPQVTSRHPGFFVLNTSQFVNNTLNNNQVIEAVDAFFHAHGAAFAPP